MNIKRILVLGGTGFVGRHLLARLSGLQLRTVVPTRRRDRARHLLPLPTTEIIEADIHDDATLRALVAHSDAVINLVGILHGSGADFERAHATLTELAQATPMRSGCIARELTKLHEEFVRGTLLELAEARDSWRGEIVLVLGAYIPEQRETEVTSDALDERILRELEAGLHSKTIAERLAAWSGRPKRDIYERVVELKRLKSG